MGISSCIVTFQAIEGGKQGQRGFKIGASGEAKLLFKSSTDSNHSVNNLFKKKREKGLFPCVRVKTQADYLMHRYSPGNGDRSTDQQGEYTTTTTMVYSGVLASIAIAVPVTSTTTTPSSLQQVVIEKKKKKKKKKKSTLVDTTA